MLEMKNVCTSYGRIPMLRDLNLKIDEGEVVCVLGSNGAGKSTVLKTIMGLVQPDEGDIYFKGKKISSFPPHQIIPLGMAMVQAESFFPKMNVETNLQMGAYFEKDQKVINERLEEVCDIFPRLKERLSQLAGTLSGGERAMLAIARGLISHPDLLLMDEPSLGLAPLLVQQTYEAIEKINEERKITILLVEQNANKALAVSNRGYIIQKGEIIHEDSSEALMESKIVQQSYLEVG